MPTSHQQQETFQFAQSVDFLKSSCQGLLDTVDIFSANGYKTGTEAFTNSLSYVGYIALYSILSATLGRLVLTGLIAYHAYQAFHETENGQHKKMAFWNLALLMGLNEVLIVLMSFVAVYRFAISLDVLFPGMGLQERFNHSMSSVTNYIYAQMGWKINETAPTVVDTDTKKSYLDMTFEFLKEDLNDKKDCSVRFFKAGYELGKSAYEQVSRLSPSA